MRTLIVISVIVFFSCGQEGKSTTDIAKELEKTKAAENINSEKNVTNPYEKYIDTRYKYTDANDKSLIIENSLPKGGLKYIAPNGKEFVYTIFWTRITNMINRPFEFTINFPADSFELPSSPDNYFKIILPTMKMTLDKASLFNYGLTDAGFNSSLDNKLQHSSSLQRVVNSNETSLFYVVTLFKKGVEGTVRAGFSLKEDKLYYRVNDKEVLCGQPNIKTLKLQK